MRIIQGGYGQQVTPSVPGAVKGPATARSARGGVAQESPSATVENVTLSPRARQLSLESAHDDSQKVETLRSAIAGGTYSIDRRAIAQRIVSGE